VNARPREGAAVAAMVVATLLWGGTFVAIRDLVRDVPPAGLVALLEHFDRVAAGRQPRGGAQAAKTAADDDDLLLRAACMNLRFHAHSLWGERNDG